MMVISPRLRRSDVDLIGVTDTLLRQHTNRTTTKFACKEVGERVRCNAVWSVVDFDCLQGMHFASNLVLNSFRKDRCFDQSKKRWTVQNLQTSVPFMAMRHRRDYRKHLRLFLAISAP